MKSICVFILFCITYHQALSQEKWKQLGSSISGKSRFENSGSSVSINAAGDIIAIGESGVNTTIADIGRVRIFQLINNSWKQLGADILGKHESDFLGRSIKLAADGKTIIISGYANNKEFKGCGFLSVYKWDGKNWVPKGERILGKEQHENLGQSVSINHNGSIIVAGGTNNKYGEQTGVVRAFRWVGNKWMQLGKDFFGIGKDDYFGISIDLNCEGNVLAIGALGFSGSIEYGGRVEIYEWNQNAWKNKGAQIKGDKKGENAASIALDSIGNSIVIGACGNNTAGELAGQVKVYTFSQGKWIQKGASINGMPDDRFGDEVDINASGTLIVAAARTNSIQGEQSGQVVAYVWQDDKWVQKNMPINGQAALDWFGSSVGLNSLGNVLIVGARGSDANGQESGQTRVFKSE